MQVGKWNVEYLEQSHLYLVNGVVVPSITQVLKMKFPMDDSIPEDVLDNARQRGNRVHKEVEDYETNGTVAEDSEELKNYIKLKARHSFNVVDVEKIIVFELDNKPVAAGRLDQVIIDRNGDMAINDLKSTSKLNTAYLYYQTNFYRIGHNQTYGTNIQKCYATHLKGNEASFKPIVRNDAIVIKLLVDFLSEQKEEELSLDL